MVIFIDQHRGTYGVDPICAVLLLAPSTYFLHKAHQRDPVVCENSSRGLCGVTIVELAHAAEPLTAVDWA